MFYSMDLGMGTFTSLAGQTHFRQTTCVTAALAILVLDMLSGIFFCLVTYTLFGALAEKEGVHFNTYMYSIKGQGNAAGALLLLEDNPKAWYALQKSMEFTLWWTIVFAKMAAICKAVRDVIDDYFSHKRQREIVIVLVGLVMVVLALLTSTVNGEHLLKSLHFTMNWMYPLSALMMTVGVAWLYGARRFLLDMEGMVGW